MSGISFIIILLVPILFQVFMLQFRQEKRYREIRDTLHRIEKSLNS